MTLQALLAVISQVAVAVIVTAFFISLTAVAVFYCYKWGAGTIKRRSHYIRRIRKSKSFENYNSGNVEVIKKLRKSARGDRD